MNNYREMSRYIDIHKYHQYETSHPYYREMLNKIISYIIENYHKDYKTRLLEIGSGTGLLTKRLARLKDTETVAIELDKNCFDMLKGNIKAPNIKCLHADALTFKTKHKFDIIVSSFAHHHTHYKQRFRFIRNLACNLREKGVYIMGDELIPHFSNQAERRSSLINYHNQIINLAIVHGNYEVAELELQSLISGLYHVGDFKRSVELLEEEMSKYFTIKNKVKIGPKQLNNIGGVYVYVFEKRGFHDW